MSQQVVEAPEPKKPDGGENPKSVHLKEHLVALFGGVFMRRLFVLLVSAVINLAATAALADTPKAQTYAFRNPGDNAVMLILQAAEGSGDIQTALSLLKDKPSINRWVGATKGDVVRVYSAHHTSGDKPRHVNVKPDEVARALHISEQFRDLLKVAGKIQGLSGGSEDKIVVTHADYTLKEVRATLTVTGRIEAGSAVDGIDGGKLPSWIILLDFTDGAKANDAEDAAITVLTGPREPWSISANVPLRKTADVKLSDDAKGIVLKEDKPNAFYVGLDYTWGDVLSTPTTLVEALQAKILLKASRSPLDSYGVALALRAGYWSVRFPKQNILHIFDSITPFVGVTSSHFTRDTTDPAGTQIRLRGHSTDVQVGLSFDIKKAVDWIQKPAAKADTSKN